MKVNFVDLKKTYVEIKDEVDNEIQDVLDNCSFVLGPKVEQFENSFANYCGTKHAIAVNSGTTALMLSLVSLGLEPGSEVIVPVNTFFATAEAVSLAGLEPVFVDIDPNSYNIDVKKMEQSITAKTKVIIPVHLYGQICDMDSIIKISSKYGLIVIEDSCQSHGAVYREMRAGSMGDIGCFSFYPGKNLGAFGEGGMITTHSDKVNERVRQLRDHGMKEKYHHEMIGINGRMDGIQGAVLNVKLKHLDKWNNQRRMFAIQYILKLKDVKQIKLPEIRELDAHVFHLFVIQAEERDKLIGYLKDNGVDIGLHYPVPIHLQEGYRNLKYKKGDFPIAEKSCKKIVSLPMHPHLTEDEVDYVCSKIKEFYS